MDVTATMELLQAALTARFPALMVTRSALDFQARTEIVRRAGVVTIVAERVRDLRAPVQLADHAGRFSIYLLYEFERSEKTEGVAIEDEESSFAHELIEFLKAPGAGLCPLDGLEIVFSAQQVRPQGYVFAQLEYSELEL